MYYFLTGIVVGLALAIVPAVLVIRANKKKFKELAGKFKDEAISKLGV